MSALGQGGFPPSIQIGGGDQGSPAGANVGPGGGQPGAPDSPEAEKFLTDAMTALQGFLGVEQDHVDKALIEKCTTIIQGLLGSRQKGAEAALGITPAHKAMSRSYGG
jgi:hypothetical protein